jgi:simple sugar transport system ATP-binding protein
MALRTSDEVVIAARGISKRFGHVDALTGVTVELHRGEILAVFGDNGAGKSTLTKIMLGVLPPDDGCVEITGEPVALTSIRDAQARGVDAVHQDLALAPELTVLENMFLGHELLAKGLRGRLRVLDRKRMAKESDTALQRLAIKLPSVHVPISALSGGQRQAVAVARAEMWTATAILMDEPTAALGTTQSDVVCETIVSTAARGLGVMVISHDLPRTLPIAHRVLVLLRGEVVLNAPAKNLTVPQVVEVMVGHLDAAGRNG